MDRWVGRVALVTGASAGIGEAVARRLVQHGMKVVGCARNIVKIQELAATLQDEKGSLLAVKCDVTQEDQILSMFEEIKKQYGGVDVCINNAGLGHDAPLLSGATSQWKHMLDVNVLGMCICTRETVKSLRERGVDDGHIIQINSMSGHRTINNPTSHFYSATKYAVTALMEGVRNELRTMKSNIRVSGISPGYVDTEFSMRLFPNNKEKAEAVKNMQENLKPDDIADSIVYALGSPPHVQKLAETLHQEKGSLVAIKCDLAEEEQILKMFETIKNQYGGLDVCINSAGLGHDAPLLSGATSDWKHMLDVNILGLCVCTREAVKSMRERGVDDGHIIQVNSFSGHRIVNNEPTHFYSATKFALTALTEGVRNELRTMKSNIRISGISPGLVDTEFTMRLFPNDPERAKAKHAKNKNLQSDDIADGIIYVLASPPHVQVHDILVRPTEQIF